MVLLVVRWNLSAPSLNNHVPSSAANNEGIRNPRNTLTQQYNGGTLPSRAEMADFSHYQATVLMSSCKSTQRKWITHGAEKLHLGTFELRCNESTAKRCHLLTLQGSLSIFLSALCDVELVQSGSLGPALLILRRSSVTSPMSWQRCPIFSVASPVRTDSSSTPLNTARGAEEQHCEGVLWLIQCWPERWHDTVLEYITQRAPELIASGIEWKYVTGSGYP